MTRDPIENAPHTASRTSGTATSMSAAEQGAPLGRATMSSALHEAEQYHQWSYEWVAPYLTGDRILDIGSGTGNHLRHLAGNELVSLDLDRAVVEELTERYAQTRPRWKFAVADITESFVVEQLGRDSFDVVYSSNVFEHIEDDWAAFRNCAELLKPGGRLVLILPAHRSLFGCMDVLAGHFRRYDRRMVEQRFTAAGLSEVSLRYVNALGALGWLVNNRMVSHEDLSSPAVNGQIRLFDRWVIPVVKRLEGNRGMPFGQSLVAVGRKPRAS